MAHLLRKAEKESIHVQVHDERILTESSNIEKLVRDYSEADLLKLQKIADEMIRVYQHGYRGL